MTVKNKGINGSIEKNVNGFEFNVSFMGWGSLTLYEILENLNLINKLKALKNGEKITFLDNSINRMSWEKL